MLSNWHLYSPRTKKLVVVSAVVAIPVIWFFGYILYWELFRG